MTGEGGQEPLAEPTDAELQQLERTLIAAFRTECPPPHRLGEHLLGSLRGPDEPRIARHLEGCPHCQAEVRLLQRFLQQPSPEDPGPARASFPEPSPTRERYLSYPEALAALLGGRYGRTGPTGPSGSSLAAAGLRGGEGQPSGPSLGGWNAPGASLGVTFPSDEGLVALQARPTPGGRYDLLVLVTPSQGSPEGLPLWLRREGRVIAAARTDAAGNAVFSGLEAGRYDLAVQHPALRVWVKEIRLGPGTDAAGEDDATEP